MNTRHISKICLLLMVMSAFILLQGCKETEAAGNDTPTSNVAVSSEDSDDPIEFFIVLEDKMAEESLKSIAIIEITDPRNNDIHRIRNVRQATMEQLTEMVDVAVREVSEQRASEVLGELAGQASTGLDPEDIEDIGIKLGVDVLLFASIESKQNDVFFWAYSTMSKELIFSDTLRKWKLPVGGGIDDLLSGFAEADKSDENEDAETE